MDNEALQERFLEIREGGLHTWKSSALQAYRDLLDSFLERLLLVIHLTAGQPARATELLTIRHCNGQLGSLRNIFIERGLIGTVTTYHKGYSTTGSTKIIHRYLPMEVSKVVVYYLQLVLPFWHQITLVALRDARLRSHYL